MSYFIINSKDEEITKISKRNALSILDGDNEEVETPPKKKADKKADKKAGKKEIEKKKDKKTSKKKSGGKTPNTKVNKCGYGEDVYLVKRDGSIVEGTIFQILINEDKGTKTPRIKDEDGKIHNGLTCFKKKSEAKAFLKAEGGGKKSDKKKTNKKDKAGKKKTDKKDKAGKKKTDKKDKKPRCGLCKLINTEDCEYEDTDPDDYDTCDSYKQGKKKGKK